MAAIIQVESVHEDFLSIVCFLCASHIMGCNKPVDPGQSEPLAIVLSAQDIGIVAQDERLRGRDGGYSGLVGNEQVWVFGDSVITEPNANGSTWLSSSFSFNSNFGTDSSSVFLPLADDESGLPVELFESTEEESQYNLSHQGEDCLEPCGARWALWPGPVVADNVRNRSIVFYGKVHAAPGEFNFYGVGQSIALWTHGEPRPTRLVLDSVADHQTLLFDASEPQFGPGAFAHEENIYVYACDRVETVKPCKLARAPLSTVTTKQTWTYFSGEGGWADNSEDLTPLFHGSDIMSVSYNSYLQAFTAVYSEPLSRNIHIRTATNPEGPWSKPVTIATALPSANGNGWVYDGLAHEEMNQQGGRVIFVTYTRDDGQGIREMRLLRVELARI